MNDRYRTDRIVELDRFVNVGEAMAVKNLLEHNDIRAVIDGEAMAAFFGTMIGPNIAGVRVRVFESDLPQAREILAREWDDESSDEENLEEEAEPVAETNLEESTAAGLEFLGTEQKIPGPHHASSPDQDHLADVPAEDATAEDASSPADAPSEHLVRAWRASCMSLVLFPIFMNFYSLWVLAREVYRTGRADNWRHYATVLMNMIVLGFYITLFTVFPPPRLGPSPPPGSVRVKVHTSDGQTTHPAPVQPKWVERTIP